MGVFIIMERNLLKVGDKVVMWPEKHWAWRSEHVPYMATTVTIKKLDMYEDEGTARLENVVIEEAPTLLFDVTSVWKMADGFVIDWDARREERRKQLETKFQETVDKYPEMVVGADKLYDIAAEIFGEERVYIKKDLLDSSKYNLVVYYPEFNITNSAGETHKIRDLYIVFVIVVDVKSLGKKSGYKASISFQGTRRGWSVKEWQTGYAHSHLPGRADAPVTFCLGSSDFGILLENVKLHLGEEDWRMALLSLTNYVEWESMEGGPHAYMSQIGYTKKPSAREIMYDCATFIDKIPKQCWEYRDGSLRLILGSRLEAILAENAKMKSPMSKEELEKDAQAVRNRAGQQHPFIFKGMKVGMKLHTEDLEAEEGTMAPAMVGYYVEQLEKTTKAFLNKYAYEQCKNRNKERAFREIGIVKQTKTDNSGEPKEKDRLLAQ